MDSLDNVCIFDLSKFLMEAQRHHNHANCLQPAIVDRGPEGSTMYFFTVFLIDTCLMTNFIIKIDTDSKY